MADITMCTSEYCPMKFSCYRANAEPNPLWQSYSDFEYTCHEENGFCDYIKDFRKMKK